MSKVKQSTTQLTTKADVQNDEQRLKFIQEYYTKTLSVIAKYFGVSDECASYLFHRVSRSKRKDHRFIAWTKQLQNAIVKADKCMQIKWKTMVFGTEEKQLEEHGIIIDEMSNDKVFRWTDISDNTDNKWTVVTKKKDKKIKKKDLYYIIKAGLFM